MKNFNNRLEKLESNTTKVTSIILLMVSCSHDLVVFIDKEVNGKWLNNQYKFKTVEELETFVSKVYEKYNESNINHIDYDIV